MSPAPSPWLPPLLAKSFAVAGLSGLVLGIGPVPAPETFATETKLNLVRPMAGGDLFTNGTVWRIAVRLEPDQVAALRDDPRSYVPATVRDQAGNYAGAEVHLKGSTGSFRPLDDKPGLTLRFDATEPGRTFHGLRKVHLNNSVEDPSYMHEHLGAELFRRAGIPAPRVGYALVELNGRPLGLYVLKEGFTVDFLAGYFHDTGGNLYEPEDGHDVDQPMKRHSGRGSKKDQRDLQALAAAVQEIDPSRRAASLAAVLDTDEFLTFAVTEVMIGHRDGYCLARNNFRVYHDVDKDRIVFLPHGMDQLFGRADFPWRPHWSGLVAGAWLNLPAERTAYAARFRELFPRLLQPAALQARIDQWLAELRPALPAEQWAEVRTAAQAVKQRIADRQANLAAQLAQPEPDFLEFVAGRARVAGWQPGEAPAGGRLAAGTAPDGRPALEIAAGPVTSSAWRTTALLRHGAYRFSGRAWVADLKPLPFGRHQGAGLRVAGRVPPVESPMTTPGWHELSTNFEVAGEQETVELVCELRASAGRAWFDPTALELTATPLTNPALRAQ